MVLCRVERRPPRLDLTVYPHLPRATVAMTSAKAYLGLLSGASSSAQPVAERDCQSVADTGQSPTDARAKTNSYPSPAARSDRVADRNFRGGDPLAFLIKIGKGGEADNGRCSHPIANYV
jgi:hypothetical protein